MSIDFEAILAAAFLLSLVAVFALYVNGALWRRKAQEYDRERQAFLNDNNLMEQEVARWRHDDELRQRVAAYAPLDLRSVEKVGEKIGMERAVYRNFVWNQANFATEKLVFDFMGRGFRIARTELLMDPTDSEAVLQVFFDKLPKRIIAPQPSPPDSVASDDKAVPSSPGIEPSVAFGSFSFQGSAILQPVRGTFPGTFVPERE